MQHSKEQEVWGYLRETTEAAQKAGIDSETGLHRTGLDEYLKAIFPDVDDWVHDKSIGELNGVKTRKRPDYRSDSLKLIVEFDGLPHYTSPVKIYDDLETTRLYEATGWKVVRIPFFIQLTNAAIEQLFGVRVSQPMFNPKYPSLTIKGGSTPAFLCPMGIDRMIYELSKFPEQYKTNVEYLKNTVAKAAPSEQEKLYKLSGLVYLINVGYLKNSVTKADPSELQKCTCWSGDLLI